MTTPPGGSAPDDTLSGALLRSFRKDAGLTQHDAADLSGVSQAQLARMEGPDPDTPGRGRPRTSGRGAGPPYPLRRKYVEPLLRAYAAFPATHVTEDRMTRLISQAVPDRPDREDIDTRVVLQQGKAHNTQRRVAEAEANAQVVRCYDPTVPLGVLQTPDFMDATFIPELGFTPADAAASVDVRLSRAAKLIDEPARRWRLIQTEQAIRWPVRDYALQAALVDRMVDLSRLPNVELGVVPLDTLAPEPAPLTNFNLYDDEQVLVETELGLTLLREARQVQPFVRAFTMLADLAVWGDDARTLLAGIAADYRGRGIPRPR